MVQIMKALRTYHIPHKYDMINQNHTLTVMKSLDYQIQQFLLKVQLVILGAGDKKYEEPLEEIAEPFSVKVLPYG